VAGSQLFSEIEGAGSHSHGELDRHFEGPIRGTHCDGYLQFHFNLALFNVGFWANKSGTNPRTMKLINDACCLHSELGTQGVDGWLVLGGSCTCRSSVASSVTLTLARINRPNLLDEAL